MRVSSGPVGATSLAILSPIQLLCWVPCGWAALPTARPPDGESSLETFIWHGAWCLASSAAGAGAGGCLASWLNKPQRFLPELVKSSLSRHLVPPSPTSE